MDGTSPVDLLIFAVASFAASLVAGLAGFAFGLVAAAVWLHILTPVQTTALIVAFGLWCRASRCGSFAAPSTRADCCPSSSAARSAFPSAPSCCAGRRQRI